MSKLVLAIILFAISSSVLCKEPWQCDSLGKFNCANNQTCCRSKVSTTGWACFPMVQAICCSDGISACPQNTICNLAAKRCDAKPRAFLQVETEAVESTMQHPEEVLAFLSEVSTLQPEDALAFVTGFNNGLSFFLDLAHQAECQPDDPQIIQDVIGIYDIIKSASLSDFSKIIPEILAKGVDAYQRISKISSGCKLYADEIQKVVDALTTHVKESGYYASLTLHTLSNVGSFSKKAQNGISAFKANNFNQSGFAFGDLIKFALFWNFKQ